MNRNSLSGLLSDIIQISENSQEILTKLSETFYTTESFVNIDIYDPTTNITRTVKVPSFKTLLNRIESLEKNASDLANFDTESLITLSDGSVRKLSLTKLNSQIEPIDSNVPNNFNIKNNWFFENMMTPLLTVSVNLPQSAKGAYIYRYILVLDTENKELLFENRLKGRNDITFQEFLTFLNSNNIQYFLDEEEVLTPPYSNQYYGKFSVLNVTDDTITLNDTTKRVLSVTLDKLSYSDSESPFEETRTLRIGDSLVVNDGSNTTRYLVEQVNSNTTTIAVSKIEGFSPITVGADVLSYYQTSRSTNSIDVSVGFDEDLVIFTKPISSDNLVSETRSRGFAISTADLTIIDENGDEITMNQYYTSNVIDFGKYLYSMAKDALPPTILGEIPDTPVVDIDNFKVVQINNHLFDIRTKSDIQNLNGERNRLKSLISDLDRKIQEKRNKIFSTNFESKSVEDLEKSELNTLISDRESIVLELQTTINNLSTILNSDDVSADPKYRIRGFVTLPEAKLSNLTEPQEVIQFKYRYRYLSKKGNANEPNLISYKDKDNVVKTGSVPSWVTEFTEVRERLLDENTGQYYWGPPDLESSDKSTLNQIEIAVRAGESVEIQVKSISEAGYPQTPLESEWSDSITITFPEDLDTVSPFTTIKEQVTSDLVNQNLQSLLDGNGVTNHISDTFSGANKTFLHNSDSIYSGFVVDGVPQSLFEKLTEMTNTLNELKAIINKAVGKLVVKIVDENGNETRLTNNTKIRLNAGNYKDEVKNLTIKKGAIVTKTYFLKLENEAATDLELYARIFGSAILQTAPSYNDGSGNFNANDTDYNYTRRYDLQSISLRNESIDNISNYTYINNSQFSSSQVRGQYIAIRYRSLDGIETYTSTFNDTTSTFVDVVGNDITTLEDCENYFDPVWTSGFPDGNPSTDFIWKGLNNNNVISNTNALNILNTQNDSILVHIEHPEISNWVSNYTTNGFNSAGEQSKSEVRVVDYSNLNTTQPNFKKSMGFDILPDFLGNIRTPRIGFRENDQYLIGSRSCGAYLFLAPNTLSDITVNGADSLSRKLVEFGPNNGIKIPIIFQYRMSDYFGFGSSGLGKIGGDPTGATTQLTYTKALGIDIFSGTDEKFSVDIEITANYSSNTFNSLDVPTRTFTNAIDDLQKSIQISKE